MMLRKLIQALGLRPIGGPPRVLVFPAWTENPFLAILERSARDSGYRFPAATTFDELVKGCRRLRPSDALHIHWTTPLLQQVPTRSEAIDRLHFLERMLRKARRRGVRIIWTVHNRLPHELRYPEEERALYRLLAESAAAVHVMAPASAEVLADVVKLDAKTIRSIPHPSYTGLYPPGPGRAKARERLGLASEDRAVLFFGQIRPYKGVDVLLEAALHARRSGVPVSILLAGEVKEQTEAEVRHSLPAEVPVIARLSHVPDDALALWFQAADIAVLPYRAVLNSGSVHLAATFHVPVILPAEPHLLLQFGDQRWVAFFDPSDAASSIAELLADPLLFNDVTSADFDAFLAPIAPERIARAYKRLLDVLTGDLRR